MRKAFLSLSVATASFLPCMVQAADLALTPNTNQRSGVLPSGYNRLTFQMGNGNWVKTITLPANPRHNDVVSLRSNAAYAAEVGALGTDFPVRSLPVTNGDRLDFTYDMAKRIWIVSGIPALSPRSTGASIANNPAKRTSYAVQNGDWVPEILLPKQAKDGDVIAIRSDATWNSKVNTTNVLFASTLNVATGDIYVFSYRGDLGKWVLEHAPVRSLAAVASIPQPTSPRTVVNLRDAAWLGEITLPASAGDRDRVTVRSDATFKSKIRNQKVNFDGPMELQRGQEYEFLYVKEDARWEMLRSPDTVFQARNLAGGILPSLVTPRTVVKVANANWVATLKLPKGQKKGTRVVVESEADWSLQVSAAGLDATVRRGDVAAYAVDAAGQWKRETVAIDLLLLYSDRLVGMLGESAARARMFESFSLTNEALENSGANFRFRMAGLRKFSAPSGWTTLGQALNELRTHAVAQGWRNELKADGIYYEGTEEGCGLAYLAASVGNMVATGSSNCGTTVMRHEMGHNMGVAHAGESGNFAQGYAAVKSVMGGNDIPYFATPWRFTSDLGMRMGIVNQVDAVRAMNARSAMVAAYR